MILHDFVYEWDGKSQDGEKPVSWWPGSYHVKIVSLVKDSDNISFLVPVAVILKNAKTNQTMNTSLRNYIHSFAEKISKKYELDLEKTLWIEIDDEIRAIRLQPDPKIVAVTLFDVKWRPIRPNELEMIDAYIENM